MSSEDIEWDIDDHGHLYRYPSQWDPTSKTYGGYLKGKVTIPLEMIPQDEGDISELYILVSPDFSPEDQEKMREELGEQYLSIHPAILKVVRKKDGRRNGDAEPYPNSQHGVQEFFIRKEDGKLLLYIRNKTSDKDDQRNIPENSFMFELKKENDTVAVKLGGGKDELMLIILLPLTDVRDKKGELNISSVLRSRTSRGVCDELTFKKLRGFFEKADNRHTVRLVAKVFKENVLLGSASSPGILDTAHKSVGALNVSRAAPLFSCDMGGTEVIMVSEYKNWHKSVIPTFYLKSRDGSRIAEDSYENRRLVQPKKEDISNDGKSLSFLPPAQPHLEDWQGKGMQLYLRVKRPKAPKVEEALSQKSFPFQYISHARIPSDLKLCFHKDSDEVSVDQEGGWNSRATSENACGMISCLPKQTGPGLKRRILHEEKSEESAKVSKKDLAPGHPPQQPEDEFIGSEIGVPEQEVPPHNVSESAETDPGSGVDSPTVQLSVHQSISDYIPKEVAIDVGEPNTTFDLFLSLFSNATSEDTLELAASELQQDSSESAWTNLAAPNVPAHFDMEENVKEQDTSSVRNVQYIPTFQDLLPTENEGMFLFSKNT